MITPTEISCIFRSWKEYRDLYLYLDNKICIHIFKYTEKQEI